MKLQIPELHYNLGHVLFQQGDWVGAIAAYRQAIGLNPSFAQAHHSLAVALGEQGQLDAAIYHYHQVIALQPNAVKALNNIGCILIEQGQVEAALPVYRQALKLEPNSAILHSNFGKAMEAQNPVAAIAAYRQAIRLQPDLISARYYLAQALRQQGQPTAAIAEFEQLLQRQDSHAATHSECGFLYSQLGNWEQAFSHFQQALSPQRSAIRAFCDWADQLVGKDELTLARQACSQFLQALFAVETASAQITSAQITSTRTAPAKPRKPNAFSLIKAAVTHQTLEMPQPDARPAMAETYWRLANLLTRYGGTQQLHQAEIYYQRALQLQPHRLELFLGLVQCLGQQQRWNAALMLGRLALVIHPNAAELYRKLGWILEQQQRWQEAISYYQQALQQGKRLAMQRAPFQYSEFQYSECSEFDAKPPAASPELSFTLANRIQGIYPSTLSWTQQKRSCRYIALAPAADHTLIRHPEPTAHQVSSQVSSQVSPTEASPAISLPCSASHSDCGGLNCYRCLQKNFAQFSPIHLGRGLYTLQAQNLSVPPPAYFVAQIPQAQAWMTPYQSPWMVANSVAILTPDRHLLADVSREYPGQLPGCSHPQPAWERILQPPLQPEPIAGQVVVLAGLSGHNYFHWLVDVLPRFELLRRGEIDLNAIDWFWINRPDAAFQQETLRHLGIPAAKILASDHHPHLQAEQLIVPSFAGHLGWLEPWALAFLRQRFLPIAAPDLPHYERIYISRAGAHHRRLLNEADVLDRLQALGFVAVELESLSFAEQIALFAHAKVIIAPHGGGLTNTIFCAPGTTILELFAPSYIRHYYWVISHHLGLHHYFLKGEEIARAPLQNLIYPSPLMEDIWIDQAALHSALACLELD